MRTVLARAMLAAPCFAALSSFAFSQELLTESQIAALAQSPAAKAAVEACRDDRSRLCASVVPGGGRIVRCLGAKAESLSPQCKTALIAARDANAPK